MYSQQTFLSRVHSHSLSMYSQQKFLSSVHSNYLAMCVSVVGYVRTTGTHTYTCGYTKKIGEGVPQNRLAEEYGVGLSTIKDLKRNEHKIREFASSTHIYAFNWRMLDLEGIYTYILIYLHAGQSQ